MPLKGKYLKYSPEITLEIFTLICNKLEDSGFQSIKKSENYKYFSQSHNFLINTKGNYYFTRDNYSSDLDGKTETTVQEILGYDPFVKDDFVLPEKWYIKCTPESKESLDEWTGFSWKYDYIYFNGKSKGWSNTLYDDHTEITFEQFKKYVLKESIEKPKQQLAVFPSEGFCKTDSVELRIYLKNKFPNCTQKNWDKKYTIIAWNSVGYWWCEERSGKPEYTLEQLKPFFNIEIPKESIPEYVECIEGYSDQFTKGKIYKISTTFTNDYHYHTEIDDRGLPNGWSKNKFKPSTKEAFDAQNNSKPIEKWSVGSYGVVVIKGNSKYNIGFIDKVESSIDQYGTVVFEKYLSYKPNDLSYSKNLEFKWFATKSEAEEFVKTLVEPVKQGNGILDTVEVKQAVHCKTQEEWDFVTEKLGYKWIRSDWYGEDYCINTQEKKTANKSWWVSKEYQILSFQEWCDLNGYKMEKEVKFEVGKWYKSNYFETEYYLKYDKTIREIDYNKIFYSILIKDGEIKENGYIAYTALEKSFNLLTDLSEIQQYLPNNHIDKIKSNQKFKVGDYVFAVGNIKEYKNPTIGQVVEFNDGDDYDSKVDFNCNNNKKCIIWSNIIRHATPEEINNHLLSIGQIPDLIKQESEKYPFKPLKPGDLEWEIQVSQIKTHDIMWCESAPMTKDDWKHKMTLPIDDEDLPMVSIIKTNTIKQLLSND